MISIDDLVEDTDLTYEGELAKNANQVDTWLSYYDSKINESLGSRLFVIRRAIEANREDARLWKIYLDLVLEESDDIGPEDQFSAFDEFAKIQNQPWALSLWSRVLGFLIEQHVEHVTYIRHKFNQCLQNLPVEDHGSIWPLALSFADSIGGKTAVNIYKRFITFVDPRVLRGLEDSEETETSLNMLDFISKLNKFGDVDTVLKLYDEITASNAYSKLPASQLAIHLDYLNFMIQNRKSSTSDKKFGEIVSRATKKFPDQSMRLQQLYIKYLLAAENPDKSQIRKLYKQALADCKTVHDFKDIYNGLAEFEEDEIQQQIIPTDPQSKDSKDLKRALDEYEKLLNDRKLLVNDIQLRKDINNVDYWFTRFEIHQAQLPLKIKAIAESIKSINPLKIPRGCTHKLSDIWKMYAEIYSSSSDFKTADFILSKSVQSQYPHPDELAGLYIYWGEMRLSNDYFAEESALELFQEILFKEEAESFHYLDSQISVQRRITKSIKLWQFYIDLLESFIDDGELGNKQADQVVEAYEQMISLKIASGNTMMKYASFLEEQQQIEKSLSIYERALVIFKDELIQREIWKVYSTKLPLIDNKERVKDIKERFNNLD
ncbi:uncharacterized protein LODBEIA_P39550 [Lodderomyces beijingensis]|uniref:Pre-mRNA-splicing factor SYF1 n=1 Tax=Lodderomyces beijingensis TaxID=1775926 RepID=A0ABP0ZNJ3_9ASCO